MHEISSIAPTTISINDVAQVHGYERIRAAYSGYLSDESKMTLGAFDDLFFPKDEAELAAVVRAMAQQKTSLTVAGARTGLVGGSVPPFGALVSLEKMNHVLDLYFVEPADEWRVRAQPGVLLSELSNAVATGNFPDLEENADSPTRAALDRYAASPETFFYPPDPTEMSASLGGTVATNASGARTFRYGPTRAWVRGLRVMTVGGEVLSIPRGKYFSSPGGEFVIYDSKGRHTRVQIPDYSMPRTKCTAGFFAAPHMDLVDLFIGSEGSLGIITAIDVGLLPHRPRCAVVQFAESDDQALDLILALRSDKRLQLDFLEFYSSGAIELLRRLQAEDFGRVGMPPLPESAGGAVFFEFHFDPESSSPEYAILEAVVASVGADLTDSWAAYESREIDRFKAFRHLLPETVSQVIARRKKDHPGLHRLSSDLAVPDEHLLDIWKIYEQSLNEAGIEWVAYGHAGNNHLHISSLPKDMAELKKGTAIYTDFARQAVAYGGTVSAEHGIGKLKAKLLKTMYSKEQLQQMQALKRAFDPDLLLNPENILTD